MRWTLSRAAALVCVAAVFAGADQLVGNGAPAAAYALLLAGAAGLTVLRALPEGSANPEGRAASWARLTIGALLLAASVGLAVWNAVTVIDPARWPASGPRQIALWLAAAACAVAAGHLWDSRHRVATVQVYDARDWIIAGALVAFGAVARIANLGTDPPGLSMDESWPLVGTLEVWTTMQRTAFTIDVHSMSGLYHWMVAFFLQYASWLGLDLVQTAKLPNALCGALAVGTVYLTVRIFSPRATAATAALFLTWLGWPWILSRLYYSYSGDLLWVGLTTWLAVLGFTTGRLSAVAAAGFTAALGAAWMKTALLAIPWLALICADFTVWVPRTARRRWVLPFFCAVALAVSLTPLVAEVAVHPEFAWRMMDVARERVGKLAEYGLSSTEGYLYGMRGALVVLQIQEANVGRHVVRLGHPALDLMTSALATIGAVWALWHAWRVRSARLALLGFLVFLVPAVTSFPVDGNPAASRRMVGSAFFIVWMAGCGAAVVAERMVRPARRTAIMLTLAGVSVVLNIHAIRTGYFGRLSEWHGELGVQNVYLIRAFRESAQLGPVFFRPTFETHLASLGMYGVPGYVLVGTPEELRQALRDKCGRICTVVLPWPSVTDANDTPKWIEQLSDVIPPSAWTFGPEDRTGIPIYRRAQVRGTPDGPLPW